MSRAQTSKAAKGNTSPGHEHVRGLVRRAIGLVGLVISLFVLVALISFSTSDPPSPRVALYPDKPHNWCGLVGAYAAYYLFHYLGPGAYTLLIDRNREIF